MKKLFALILALAMVFALAACSGGTDEDKDPADNSGQQTENKNTGTDNKDSNDKDSTPAGGTLDVALTNSFTGAYAIGKENPYRYSTFNQVYETLFCVVDGEYKGVLAESFERLDDTTYQIKLYNGITDSEGNPFTAEDAVWAIQAQKDNSCNMATYWEDNAAEVVDELTFTLKLNTDSIGAFYNLATRVFFCTEEAYNDSGDGMATFPIGTGPYKCDSYVEGSSCTLVKRDDYWKTENIPEISVANFDTINISYVPEATQMAIAIDSGSVKFAGQVDMSISGDVDTADGMQAIYMSNGTYNGMAFNMTGRIVSDNLKLRQAICYAIDCAGLAQGAYSGHATIMNNYGMPTASDYDESWTCPISYDLEKAKELLAEAGYPDGVKITLVSNNVGEDSLIAELAQGYLSMAGIDVYINFCDPATQSTVLNEGDWDICWVGGLAVSDMSVFYSNIYKNAQKGTSSYFNSDPELVEIYSKYYAAGGKTAENLQALYEYESANCTWFPLFNKQVLYALSDEYSYFFTNDLYMNLPVLGTIS
ncbi:MAG: ABC transporter substrate-binding protein [Oscillospiraceae bacterium]